MRKVTIVCLATGLASLWAGSTWAASIVYSEVKVGLTFLGADLSGIPPCYAQLTLDEGSAEARCQADSGTPFLWNASSLNGNPKVASASVRDKFAVTVPGFGLAEDIVARVRITGTLTVPLTGVPLDPNSPVARVKVSARYLPFGEVMNASRAIFVQLTGFTTGPELFVNTDGQWTTDHNSVPAVTSAGGFGQVVFSNHLVQFCLNDFMVNTVTSGDSITWELEVLSSLPGAVADFYGTMEIDTGLPIALASGDEILPLPADASYQLGERGRIITVLCFNDGFESGDTDQWSTAAP
jgi:hypothetical protein